MSELAPAEAGHARAYKLRGTEVRELSVYCKHINALMVNRVCTYVFGQAATTIFGAGARSWARV